MQFSVGLFVQYFIFILITCGHGLPSNNETNTNNPTESTPIEPTTIAATTTTTSKPTTAKQEETTTQPPKTTQPTTVQPTTTQPTTTPTTFPPTTGEPTTRPPAKIRARLADGMHPWEGRVEVSMHGGSWGTVCDDGFNMNAANVVCKMVGYKKAVQYFFGSSQFGRGPGRILLDEVECLGTEKNLLACEHNPIGVTDCSHSEDVGIRCIDVVRKVTPPEKKLKQYKFRLVGDPTPKPQSEGVVEVMMTGKWRTICSDGWDMEDARVLCGSLGFKEATSVEPNRKNKSRQRKKSIVASNFECTGNEHNVSDCERTLLKSHKDCLSKRAAEAKCERGPFVMDADKPYSPPWSDVRLKAGAAFGEGRLEVFHAGRWGTVCGEDFDKVAASVVCRKLGFGTAETVLENASAFGQGIGPIWLWEVDCKGTEASIMECGHGAYNRSKCDHSQDVGIKCNIPDLGVKEDIRLVQGRFDTEGRVLINYEGQWGHPCGGDSWDMFDAKVACRQLGLGYAHQPMRSTRFMGRSGYPILMLDVNCTGNERTLSECPHVRGDNGTCMADYKAGILCAGVLPDVLMDVHVLQSSIYMQDWPMYMLQCAAEENCLSSESHVRGARRLLRFASAIMNRGTEEFRPVLGRSSWEWHACHRHYHSMDVFSTYDLLDADGVRVAEGHKASFCLEDVYCDSGAQKVYSCDAGTQGISVNCVDIYRNDIDCQWIDVTGVPQGSYVLRVDVNPNHIVGETDFTNNEVLCDVMLTYRVRIQNCRYADDS
ncbi:lysyl oxidase-like 2 isoform X1 [Strongylocentrotus purpuratus]|uniref:protein-lysine 6-oxidase n=1 Tax=Strongylocentrotus purpuratus TaxID=7668 RepID=A0A7M7SYP7_STRPU|nr:lysyl oxidase-like 2 isoform X1 [Strongylocentrotus purpuratus]